jgi:hypothetical protein
MGVDMEVTVSGDSQIEPAVTAQLVEHVVVKRDACRDVGDPTAIEIDRDLNRGLFGGPGP